LHLQKIILHIPKYPTQTYSGTSLLRFFTNKNHYIHNIPYRKPLSGSDTTVLCSKIFHNKTGNDKNQIDKRVGELE